MKEKTSSCWNELLLAKLLSDTNDRKINYKSTFRRSFLFLLAKNDNQLTKLTGDAVILSCSKKTKHL
jgi:hypothetical protein